MALFFVIVESSKSQEEDYQEEGPKGHLKHLCHVRSGPDTRIQRGRMYCSTTAACKMHDISQAFNMIDQTRDGFVDKEDLKDMLASLGELIWVTDHA